MQSVYIKFVALFFAEILFLQSAHAQGTCTCLGGTGSGTDVNAALRTCMVTDDCDLAFNCPTNTCNAENVLSTGGLTTLSCGISFDGSGNPVPQTCVPGVGTGFGEPHLIGFDGTRFDFHGTHGKNYVIFGRPSGDMLVSKMRATDRMKVASGVNATFFDEFGLQVAGSSDRVGVYLARNSAKDGHWTPKVVVNGNEISESLSLMSCHVSFHPEMNNRVSITTRESKFIISTGRSEDDHLHHLNLRVKLTQRPSAMEKYIGVLGVTLNRALGHDIHPDLDVTGRPSTLEMAMRNRFEVESLFPRGSDPDMKLNGAIRMISDINHVDEAWSAESHSI